MLVPDICKLFAITQIYKCCFRRRKFIEFNGTRDVGEPVCVLLSSWFVAIYKFDKSLRLKGQFIFAY